MQTTLERRHTMHLLCVEESQWVVVEVLHNTALMQNAPTPRDVNLPKSAARIGTLFHNFFLLCCT